MVDSGFIQQQEPPKGRPSRGKAANSLAGRPNPGDLPVLSDEELASKSLLQLIAGITLSQELTLRESADIMAEVAAILGTPADSLAILQKLEELAEGPNIRLIEELLDYLIQHPKLGEAAHRAIARSPEPALPANRPEEAFPEGLGEMPSVRPMWSVQEAILHSEMWQRDSEDGFPRYVPRDGRKDIVVGYTPNGAIIDDLPQALIEGLLDNVRRMNLDTLDTLCIVVNLLAQNGDYSCNITPQAIAALRGVKYPSSHQNFVRYREALKHISHLTLKATIPWVKQDGCPLSIEGHLIIVDGIIRQHSLGGNHTVLGWHVVAGSALKSILSHARNPRQIFPQALIQLDTYHQEVAKRLGVYLTWIFRVRAQRGNYAQPFTPKQLIQAANITVNSTKHRQNQSLFRERFENALDTLHQLGITGPWQYVKTPEQELALTDNGRLKRGWFQSWLNMTLRVDPPADSLVAYSKRFKGAGRYLSGQSLQE